VPVAACGRPGFRVLPEMEGRSERVCGRCDLVAKLQGEVGRLRSIGESKEEMDPWSCALPSLVLTGQPGVATAEGGPRSVLWQEEGSVMGDREGWKQVTAWSCKRNPLGDLYTIGARFWVSWTKRMMRWERRNLCKHPHQRHFNQHLTARPAVRPALQRNKGKLRSSVTPSGAEQRCPFADQTLFSGKFAPSLGSLSGMPPGDR